MAASEVCCPRITSRTGTMWAGWKKWEPPMRSGWAMRSPTWVMGRPEVLLASTVSRGAAASMRRKSSCLAARFSVIDSTTNSAEPTASSSSVVARMRSGHGLGRLALQQVVPLQVLGSPPDVLQGLVQGLPAPAHQHRLAAAEGQDEGDLAAHETASDDGRLLEKEIG